MIHLYTGLVGGGRADCVETVPTLSFIKYPVYNPHPIYWQVTSGPVVRMDISWRSSSPRLKTGLDELGVHRFDDVPQ